MLALLWFGTTLAGFRAVRQHRYADHRQWMLRSVALTFSIIANRVWIMILFAIFVPEIYTGGTVDPVADGSGHRGLGLDELGGQPDHRRALAAPTPAAAGLGIG